MSPVDYQKQVFPFRRSHDQDRDTPAHHPVIIVGAGPVGLALAIDLAQQGQAVVVLDNDDRLSEGSRAICFAKRTLEIFDRLGCGDSMVQKGVSWNVGKVFFKDEAIYSFDLLPDPGHERPAFINLQQYYLEGYLVERALQLPLIDLRWKNEVVGTLQAPAHCQLFIDTPEGSYRLNGDYVVACDGARSAVRRLSGLESHGRTFQDRFLIADVKMKAHFPAERWFWFDPPFHPNQSVLLHMQPDNVWRIDFQLGWDADPEREKRPENIIPRVKALLGEDAQFDLEWASVYTFACQRMDKFRHGRLLFAGDAAHRVSPFGARGANSGVQDSDNLAWKLARVLRGDSPDALLDSYAFEREYAADENLLNSTRATDFITPKSDISRLFRDATLQLAKQHTFARSLVNSGRLSLPATLVNSPLNTADVDVFAGLMVPGAPAADTPLMSAQGTSWLLREFSRTHFTLLICANNTHDNLVADLQAAAHGIATLSVVRIGEGALHDVQRLVRQRYDLQEGTAYLLRPDHHICARWRTPTPAALRAALQRATGHSV